MENLAFYNLLRWKMIILPILITSLIHFSLGRLGEWTFWAYGSERVKAQVFPRGENLYKEQT